MTEKTTPFEGWIYCSGSAMKRATRQIGQLYDDILAPSGLRGTQYSLMSQIYKNPEPSLKSLATSMVMDLSALGHTLKPLTRDGLVELVPDQKDRRVKRARLTAAGIRKWEEATPLWREARDRFDHVLGEAQSQQLRDMLNLVASPAFSKRFVTETADKADE